MTVPLSPNAATGIAGLDDVFGGGFERGRVFLLEGRPGAGKTAAALSWLMAGAAAGELALHVTLPETEGEPRAAIARGERSIAIDSMNGCQAAMPEEEALVPHLRELLRYLVRQGATTALAVARHGLLGDMRAPHPADTVIRLRHRQRAGADEDTARELRDGPNGLRGGEPLACLRAVQRSVPTPLPGGAAPLGGMDVAEAAAA